MTGLARWCFRHRYLVIGVWAAVLLAVVGSSTAAGGSAFSNSFGLDHTESSKAQSLLQGALPRQSL